jgi:hypothetical protein
MSKMGSHRPFGDLKHKLWPNEKLGTKLAVWFPTNKSPESTQFPCMRMTYHWKALDEGYNFALDLITIGGLHVELCASKVVGVLIVGILEFPLGSPGTKSHLDVAPVERRKVYYKGEGGSFPQVWAVLNFMCPSCSWFVLTPKVFQLCNNHFLLVLCRPVWVIEACQFFLIPSWSSSTPFYPSIVL